MWEVFHVNRATHRCVNVACERRHETDVACSLDTPEQRSDHLGRLTVNLFCLFNVFKCVCVCVYFIVFCLMNL